MSRIAERFADLRRTGGPGLVAYVTAGDPDFEASRDVLLALERGGADVIVIPRATWHIAIAVCVVLPIVACLYWATLVVPAGESKFPPVPVLVTGALISVSLFLFILLIGYIAGDARRRGMRVVLWVLLAIFIPNAIGIILYFIMRDPLLRRCPACGVSSSSAFSFCPSCGGAISAACPSCRSAVEPGWAHCARCGATLRPA